MNHIVICGFVKEMSHERDLFIFDASEKPAKIIGRARSIPEVLTVVSEALGVKIETAEFPGDWLFTALKDSAEVITERNRNTAA